MRCQNTLSILDQFFIWKVGLKSGIFGNKNKVSLFETVKTTNSGRIKRYVNF
ncbi:hypothetical protein M153_46100063 [Pseudoloma neurophilia]|uniref:Uncharacterized protein n=1 Tax=Pseudoloma neurophilia TaxID=146866 RepID=A0A0R0M3B9_9MICR|nr:hypothetical protein M153_46100063 [Pseudoloma neurophilia]